MNTTVPSADALVAFLDASMVDWDALWWCSAHCILFPLGVQRGKQSVAQLGACGFWVADQALKRGGLLLRWECRFSQASLTVLGWSCVGTGMCSSVLNALLPTVSSSIQDKRLICERFIEYLPGAVCWVNHVEAIKMVHK